MLRYNSVSVYRYAVVLLSCEKVKNISWVSCKKKVKVKKNAGVCERVTRNPGPGRILGS